MPKITVPKETLEGRKPLPSGIEVMIKLDGFKPKLSKKKDSVNLNPQMTIQGSDNPEVNGRKVFENLNTQAGWVMKDFAHCFGMPLEGADGTDLPGEFQGPSQNPAAWKYAGPLLGKTGKILLGTGDNGKGQEITKIERYLCAVPGCTEQHTESLL